MTDRCCGTCGHGEDLLGRLAAWLVRCWTMHRGAVREKTEGRACPAWKRKEAA